MNSVSTLLSDLGQRIAAYRISRNLKQAELAEAAGIDRSTLSRLESGRATIDTLARVLLALEIEDRLLAVVPDASVNPLDTRAARGHKRQRVRDSKSGDDKDGPWIWGDEDS